MVKSFEWKRTKEGGATVTQIDEHSMTKDDWYDCLISVMVKGNISISDIINYFDSIIRRR